MPVSPILLNGLVATADIVHNFQSPCSVQCESLHTIYLYNTVHTVKCSQFYFCIAIFKLYFAVKSLYTECICLCVCFVLKFIHLYPSSRINTYSACQVNNRRMKETFLVFLLISTSNRVLYFSPQFLITKLWVVSEYYSVHSRNWFL